MTQKFSIFIGGARIASRRPRKPQPECWAVVYRDATGWHINSWHKWSASAHHRHAGLRYQSEVIRAVEEETD